MLRQRRAINPKMFNVNGRNWISEKRNEIKITVASYGIANFNGVNLG